MSLKGWLSIALLQYSCVNRRVPTTGFCAVLLLVRPVRCVVITDRQAFHSQHFELHASDLQARHEQRATRSVRKAAEVITKLCSGTLGGVMISERMCSSHIASVDFSPCMCLCMPEADRK